MADIFSLTAPITAKKLDNPPRVVAEYFKHPKGILYFDLYWHQQQPKDAMHLIEGTLTGEGPWRINDIIFNVLGCRSTNIEMALEHEQWMTYLQTADSDYPPQGLINAIAKKMGADI